MNCSCPHSLQEHIELTSELTAYTGDLDPDPDRSSSPLWLTAAIVVSVFFSANPQATRMSVIGSSYTKRRVDQGLQVSAMAVIPERGTLLIG